METYEAVLFIVAHDSAFYGWVDVESVVEKTGFDETVVAECLTTAAERGEVATGGVSLSGHQRFWDAAYSDGAGRNR